MTIPLNYSEVTMEFTGAGVPFGAAVVFGVDNTVGGLTPTGVATAVNTAIGASGIMGRLSSNLGITNLHVKNGPDSTGPFADVSVTRTGGSAGDTNPSTALLVNKASALGGRKNRGRMFFPGLIEADVGNAGVVTGTALTAFQTQFTSFLTNLSGANIPMVLLHTDGSTPTLVTSLNVASLVAIQHRRLRR